MIQIAQNRYRVLDDIGQPVSVELSPLRPELITRKHEFGFSLSYDLQGQIGIRHGFDQAAYLSRDEEVHIYPIDRGMEMEVVLLKKPKTNRFPFQVSGNVSFHKQEGERAGRPENIVDSYAIYCDKQHNQYSTGKIGHIYRAEAHDAQGARTWCAMEYSYGLLTVTVPWAFLNDAAYPVIVDPTLGYTTIGGTTDGIVAYLVASIWQIGATGTATQFNVYTDGQSFDMTAAIYNSTSTDPSTKVSVTAGGSATDPDPGNPGWKYQAIGGALTSGNYYGLALTYSGLAATKYDSVANQRSYVLNTYSSGSVPDPFPAHTNDNIVKPSWYIDYTTSGPSNLSVVANN